MKSDPYFKNAGGSPQSEEEALHERTFRIAVGYALCNLLESFDCSLSVAVGLVGELRPVLFQSGFLEYKRRSGGEGGEEFAKFCVAITNTQGFNTSILDLLLHKGCAVGADADPFGFLHKYMDLERVED